MIGIQASSTTSAEQADGSWFLNRGEYLVRRASAFDRPMINGKEPEESTIMYILLLEEIHSREYTTIETRKVKGKRDLWQQLTNEETLSAPFSRQITQTAQEKELKELTQ